LIWFKIHTTAQPSQYLGALNNSVGPYRGYKYHPILKKQEITVKTETFVVIAAPSGRIYVTFDTGNFYENMSENFQVL
jgi:hypothetical protein